MLKKDFIKKLGYTNHNVPLGQIKVNRSARHVSIDGQIVIKTCANGAFKYDKYQDIEAENETTVEKWMTQTRRNDCEQSCSGNQKTSGRVNLELAQRISSSLHRDSARAILRRVRLVASRHAPTLLRSRRLVASLG